MNATRSNVRVNKITKLLLEMPRLITYYKVAWR